jgi:hypothetical protein
MEDDADEDVIHISPPSHRYSKIGDGGYDPPKEDLGPEGGNTNEEGGWIVERGYGVPILASDEVAKHPEAEWMQPAVSPELERRDSGEYTLNEAGSVPSYVTGHKSTSRSSSRNNSIHSGTAGLSRFASPSEHDRTSTPLDNVKEYEPLFPEDEDHPQKNPKSAVDKLKRPNFARHHFPSQDTWEDAPSSLQLETTVDGPQAEDEPKTPIEAGGARVIEKPEAEASQRAHLPSPEDQKSFLPEKKERFAKMGFNKDVVGDMSSRPGLNQRFPSHDIWEDTPDHHTLVTTVSGPQTDDKGGEYLEDSPVTTEKPQIPARPIIPARPAQAKETSPVDKKAPNIPERPKPQVPARPAKPISKSSAEKVPTVADGASEASASIPKAKPAVPARPAGSKIAALKGSFMSDLNSRLQLGPQAPKVQEPAKEEQVEVQERAPLPDARKGRAKGPQRRKPAVSPSGAAAEAGTETKPAPTFSFVEACTVWETTDEGHVTVPAAEMAKALSEKIGGVEQPKSAEPEAPTAVYAETSTEEPAVTEAKDAAVPATEEPISVTTSASTGMQTGEQNVAINNTDGTTETMTTFLGGKAQEQGTVVVKDGVEHVGDSATARTKVIESASDGGLRAAKEAREEAVEKA